MALSKSGGAGRQGPALNLFRMPVSWRPALRFLTKVLRAYRRSGLRTGPRPCPRSQPRRGRTRPAFSRSASSLFGSPAVVRGGRRMLITLSFLPLIGRLPPVLYPPPHSITSSARASSFAGTCRPSVLAVLRLIISWSFVLCWTGKAAGVSPLRMRPA